MKKLIGCLLVAALLLLQQGYAQYARFEVNLVERVYEASPDVTYTLVYDYDRIALILKFYSDAACTTPYTIGSGFYFDWSGNDIYKDYIANTTQVFTGASNTWYVDGGVSEYMLDDVYREYEHNYSYLNSNPSVLEWGEGWKSDYTLQSVPGFTILPTVYNYSRRTLP